MLVLEDLVGFHRTLQHEFLQHYWSGDRLGYCDIEWFALEMNRDHSVIFETASKSCISDSFVDYDSYSKGFLPTAAAKSLQSCPTLCNPMDGSPPRSPISGILQARTPEWVAISFSSS